MVAIFAVFLGTAAAAASAAVEPEPKRTVLFVCEHGAAKSVVAAALFDRLAAERGLPLRATARGTDPDPELAPAAVAGLRQDGLSPLEPAPRQLAPADVDAAVRIITFNDLPPELAGDAAVERWEVPPVSTHYAGSRDAMLAQLSRLLDELAAQ